MSNEMSNEMGYGAATVRDAITVAAWPNDQKLSHAAGEFRQPEIRSGNGQA